MADFVFEFDVEGDKQMARGFSRFAEKVKDLRGAFVGIVKDFREGEARQFATEGNYGAGGWAPLAPSTLESKASQGYPLDILVRTRRLQDSLEGRTGDTIEEMRPLSLRMGTRVPYAGYHQRRTAGLPLRPVIMLPEDQKTRWTKIIHGELVRMSKEVSRGA